MSGARQTARPMLPANLAFVVQFRDDSPAGRVEHVVSGQATCFDSWDELRRFLERMLAGATTDRPRRRTS